MTKTPPPNLIDWTGQPWTPDCGRKAAHPNSRFTAPASQCPSIDPDWQNPNGVPISAFIFGGRRSQLVPLVYQAPDWPHGVYLAATLGSETTAAAAGQVGVVRRDPFAMLPFCGYHMGDYFRHWLTVGGKLAHPPAIFGVNWFRTDSAGNFLWPGYGENMSVLVWIVQRANGTGHAVESPLGFVPLYEDLNLQGLDGFSKSIYQNLIAFPREEWKQELLSHDELFAKMGTHMPEALLKLRAQLEQKISALPEK
jgi:phosphoenolpyruvate carboxykinase (GTP)